MQQDSYIVHGTLIDYIDYKRLIEIQANVVAYNYTSSRSKRVISARKSKSIKRINKKITKRKMLMR